MNRITGQLAMLAASSSLLLVLCQTSVAADGFEVVSHRYAVEIRPDVNSFTCIDTLELRATGEPAGEETFLLHPAFEITEIRANGESQNAERNREKCRITGLSTSGSNEIVFSYSGEFSVLSEFSRMADSNALLRTEEILPRAQEQLRMIRGSITVPSGWTAIAAGALVLQETQGDRTTFVWELHGLIQTAGWIAAGVYQTRTYPGTGIPLSTYLFPGDTASASGVLEQAADVLGFCSRKFVKYRFPALAIVEVEDWLGGGNVLAASSPTMIVVKKHAFRSEDRFNRVETILPHEIAHQWWPLTVFVGPEDVAFLSEGLCEFTALLYGEASGRRSVRDSLGTHQLLRTLVNRATKGRDLPLQQERDLRTLPSHYLKAAYVHSMLRRIIGGEAYDSLLHRFADRFQLEKAGLAVFDSLAGEVSGRNLRWFFDQWVRKSGMPKLKIYNVKTIRTDSGWVTKGRVRILGYEKFTTFADVLAQTPAGSTTERLWLGEDSLGVYRNDIPFSITTEGRPERVLLDPSGEILKMQRMSPKFSDLREPGQLLAVVGPGTGLLEDARADSAAMTSGGWSFRIKTDSAVTLVDLQSDRLLLYGRPSENSVARTYSGSFPMQFDGDSVIVDGEPIFDSTLTVLQAIDSPFSPQGIWCWIAPLAGGAKHTLLPFDASWLLVRGSETITSGTWKVKDDDLEVTIP
jgi:hypothetical protein